MPRGEVGKKHASISQATFKISSYTIRKKKHFP